MQQYTHGDLDIILSECLRANVEWNKKELIIKYFCLTDIYSFGLRHWFKFGVPAVSSPPSFDVDSEVSMVEGMLMLLVTLLSNRLHLGNESR